MSYQTVVKIVANMKRIGAPIIEANMGRQMSYSLCLDEIEQYLQAPYEER